MRNGHAVALRSTRAERTASPRRDAAATTLRCAIYTRKSTEEGLDQDFNSLDAQREAAEAFVASQRGEGWDLAPDRYDDGGYSGGNTDRPALQRLMADIDAGRVQVVVVYKVDRLSRSLLDFAKIMERFDARRVAFVSVTQQFNTATSMGRLILHVLLSFAQFEREMIAERTRDKMSAARKKGKWVGGMPVLGYDVDPKGGRLVVNETEAARVRDIFDLYLKEHSLVATATLLNERGWTLKSWTTKKGEVHAGSRFTRPNLHALLTNVLYAGQVRHHGTVYPGEQPAIVAPGTFRRANELLRGNGRSGGARPGNKHGALLKSLVRCAPCDAAMVHTYTVQRARRYRYYVCLRAQKEGWNACPSKAVPAIEIERFVVERIRGIGRDPDILAATIDEARRRHAERVAGLAAERDAAAFALRGLGAQARDAVKDVGRGTTADRLADLHDAARAGERRLTDATARLAAAQGDKVDAEDLAAALSLFDPVWDALFPREQARILALLVEGVRYDGAAGTLAVTVRPSGIRALADEVRSGEKETRR